MPLYHLEASTPTLLYLISPPWRSSRSLMAKGNDLWVKSTDCLFWGCPPIHAAAYTQPAANCCLQQGSPGCHRLETSLCSDSILPVILGFCLSSHLPMGSKNHVHWSDFFAQQAWDSHHVLSAMYPQNTHPKWALILAYKWMGYIYDKWIHFLKHWK